MLTPRARPEDRRPTPRPQARTRLSLPNSTHARRAPTPASRFQAAEIRKKAARISPQVTGQPGRGYKAKRRSGANASTGVHSCRPLSWRRVRLHVGLKPCSDIESTAAATCEVSIEPVIANGLAAKRRGRASALASLFLDKCFEFIRCHSGTLGDYSPLLSRDIRRLTKFQARRY